MRLGIDVGGTFTDFVHIDDRTGTIHYTKTLTTPGDLAKGVLAGMEKILHQAGCSAQNLEYIVHGTTIGTNALIERSGARVGLITTAGFRDVLEVARVERPDRGLYDMTVDLPTPLVPRYLRLEAEERLAADGSVIKPLDRESVKRAVEVFRTAGVEAIAVCLLFSFRNPSHEQAVREICQELLPGIPVTISAELAPEFREYERTSTTVINAYLLPTIQHYLKSLHEHLETRHGRTDLRILQASGGSMTVETAQSHAIHMVNSGPAGGALATALFGRLAGEDKIVGVDMGGTSFDVSLVIDGSPRLIAEGEFEGYPVKIPMIDVEGVGAGGGSIAWVDAGGALNVGPQSAGADPGPACYGRGGQLPTVTDANLLLGRLNPDYFLGAELPLYPDLAQKAIRLYAAERLKLSLEETAAGIIRVVNANMVRSIAVKTTQKGYDVREFSLLAFGGAGPLHAVELAEDLSMQRVVVPPFCSVFSAFGAVTSDIRHDYVQTVALNQAETSAERLQAVYAQLERQAIQQLVEERVPPERILIQKAADLRYEGQSYELTIPVRTNGLLTDAALDRLITDFHSWHKRIYAYGDPVEPVEFINLRLVGIGKVPELALRRQEPAWTSQAIPKSIRPVYFLGYGFLDTHIYERDEIQPGQVVSGPCLVEEPTSTTVIPPEWLGNVDAFGNIVITKNRETK